MLSKRVFMTWTALLVTGGAAVAHDDAGVAKLQPPHGGQLRVAGPYHLELVIARGGEAAAERPVVVYVTDHDGRRIATAGGSGSATLLVGKARQSVPLAPDGDNRLKGQARIDPGAEWKAVVSLTLPGRPTEQARFAPR